MARCFLTGVEFRVEHGLVLNRSDAYRLLRTLRNRAESLERLIAQFGPLDAVPIGTAPARKHPGRRQHRMICKAVAAALANTYPEIELFVSWPALRARHVTAMMRLLKDHPLYGPSIGALADDELIRVAELSRQVFRLIDPYRNLSPGAQLAIRAGICPRYRTESATQIALLIRSSISGNGNLVVLGVAEHESDAVRANLLQVLRVEAPSSSHEPQ